MVTLLGTPFGRVGTASRVVDKFGAGLDGFTSGNPQAGVAATELSDDWCDGYYYYGDNQWYWSGEATAGVIIAF